MKAIILLFDSLNKNYLPPYGDLLTKAPNFQRLAAHAATFDNSYVGSMPCMPARRELHTGAIISCIVSGARWNPLMIPCRNY